MKTKHTHIAHYTRGIVSTVITIVIALIILALFGFDIREALITFWESGWLQKTIDTITTTWNSHMQPLAQKWVLRPAHYVWSEFVIDIVWPFIKRVAEKLR